METENTNGSLVSKIGDEISSIKQQLANSNLAQTAKAELIRNRDILEQWYTKLLTKTGLISPEEQIDATQALVESKKTSMEQNARKTKTIAAIVLIASIALTVSVIVYLKKHKA